MFLPCISKPFQRRVHFHRIQHLSYGDMSPEQKFSALLIAQFFFSQLLLNLILRPSSHRTRITSQHVQANYGTHCGQWECSHSLQATSKDLHANVLTRPVWTGPRYSKVSQVDIKKDNDRRLQRSSHPTSNHTNWELKCSKVKVRQLQNDRALNFRTEKKPRFFIPTLS